MIMWWLWWRKNVHPWPARIRRHHVPVMRSSICHHHCIHQSIFLFIRIVLVVRPVTKSTHDDNNDNVTHTRVVGWVGLGWTDRLYRCGKGSRVVMVETRRRRDDRERDVRAHLTGGRACGPTADPAAGTIRANDHQEKRCVRCAMSPNHTTPHSCYDHDGTRR